MRAQAKRPSAPDKAHGDDEQPTWLRKITEFRGLLGLNQADFAARLHLTPAVVSFWGSKKKQPSKNSYLLLADLAKDEHPEYAAFFWRMAGMTIHALRAASPEMIRAMDQHAKLLRRPGKNTVNIPFFKKPECIAQAFDPHGEIERFIPLPASLVPNPMMTGCIRAPESLPVLRGTEMKPSKISLLGGENLILVDGSETSVEKLWDRMVIVEYLRGEV